LGTPFQAVSQPVTDVARAVGKQFGRSYERFESIEAVGVEGLIRGVTAIARINAKPGFRPDKMKIFSEQDREVATLYMQMFSSGLPFGRNAREQQLEAERKIADIYRKRPGYVQLVGAIFSPFAVGKVVKGGKLLATAARRALDPSALDMRTAVPKRVGLETAAIKSFKEHDARMAATLPTVMGNNPVVKSLNKILASVGRMKKQERRLQVDEQARRMGIAGRAPLSGETFEESF